MKSEDANKVAAAMKNPLLNGGQRAFINRMAKMPLDRRLTRAQKSSLDAIQNQYSIKVVKL